jgi:hypothetical protein
MEGQCYGGVAVSARDFSPCADVGNLQDRVVCMMEVGASKTQYALETTQKMNATTPEEQVAKMNAIEKLSNRLIEIQKTTGAFIDNFNSMQNSAVHNIGN